MDPRGTFLCCLNARLFILSIAQHYYASALSRSNRISRASFKDMEILHDAAPTKGKSARTFTTFMHACIKK